MSLINYTIYAQKSKFDPTIFKAPARSEFDWNLLLVFLFCLIIFAFFVTFIKRRRNRHLAKYLKQHSSDWNTVKEHWKVISQESEDALHYLDKTMRINISRLRKNNQIFETAVSRLYEKDPKDSFFDKVQKLREELGFVFSNQETPFICSQMLQPGQALRVEMQHKDKTYAYISTVLLSSQSELWVKPPKMKNETDQIPNGLELIFRVSRTDTLEYLFSGKVVNYLTSPFPAVVVHQTRDIKQLHSREYERYVIDIKKEFVCISGDSSDIQVTNFLGNIVDISLGGIKVFTDKVPEIVQKDSYLRFFFKEAKINKPLQVRVLRIYEEKEKTILHLQFYAMTDLNRLCLQNFIATTLSTVIKDK